MNDLLGRNYFGNSIYDYLVVSVTFLVLVSVVIFIKVFVVGRLRNLARKTETTFDDFLVGHIYQTLLPFVLFFAFYLSVKTLVLPGFAGRVIYIFGLILVAALVVRFVLSLLDYALKSYALKNPNADVRNLSLKTVMLAAKIFVVVVAAIILLDNMGVKISALVAGLGIGGLAVAFASQAILGDLFSFFVIIFDRPFDTGDFIVIGEFMGTVEHIGIKTTRIRSLGGEQLVFSNTDLTNSRVRNFKRMERRRVVFKFGVTYQTTSAQAAKIPAIVKEIISGLADTVFDRAHFFSYGDFALIYEVVFFVLGSDYNKYMDIQQDINLRIKEEFERHKIDFAYPTQTIVMSSK